MRKQSNWTEHWQRFLHEGMSHQVVDVKQLEHVFDYFHVSTQKLSDTDSFTFDPRIPRFPYEDDEGNIIEDDFTKRVSVSKTVNDALVSIEDTFSPTEWIYLYAGIGPPDAEAKQEDCPETDSMKYDTNFRMSKWLKSKLDSNEIQTPADGTVRKWLKQKPNKRGKIAPSTLPSYLRHEFEYCVPDADETKESWLTTSTKLVYLGELNTQDKIVLLSSAGLELARNAKLKTRDY